jgi:hypothetical protein
MPGRICNGQLRIPRHQTDSGPANEAATTMTPQQKWFSLPVPYAHRPRPVVGSRRPPRRDRGRQVVLTAGAVAAGVLVVVVLIGRAATGSASGEPDDHAASPQSAAADGEAAFVDAYATAGFPDLGSRDAVLRLGRAACANGGGAAAPNGATLSLADAQRVAELARLHLCLPGRTG